VLFEEARRRRRWAAGSVAAAIVAVAVVAYGGSGGSTPTATGRHASTTQTGGLTATKGTFVSLLRLCRPGSPSDYLLTGCPHGHYVEDLEQFSLSDGRRVRAIAPVPDNVATTVATPAGTNDGTVLLTYTVGSRCLDHGKPLKGPTMECNPSPNSCINTVMNVSPGRPTPARLFTVSSAQTIGAAVPSPNGSEVAYSAQPCVGTRPLPGLYVRDLKTGVTRELIKTDYCSSIGRPAWNAAGTETVFRYRSVTARPRPGNIGGGPSCPTTIKSGWNLAIAKAATGGRPVVLFPALHGCSIDAAAFDSGGIIAAEGCSRQHQSMSFDGATRGAAYLLQYNSRGEITARIALPYRGLDPNQTLIANVPHAKEVLVTQDQPNVYELNGTHLRQVVENSWGSDFIAVAW
jgi:hypothetical protein